MKAALKWGISVDGQQQALAFQDQNEKACSFHKDLLFIITNIPSKIKTHLHVNDKVGHSLGWSLCM